MRRKNQVFILKHCLAALVSSSLLMAAAAPGTAQGQLVVLPGRVQWIAGEKMMLIPDSGAPPIEIDIKKVPLDEYRTLTEGDPVVVQGVVSPDNRKVIATSVRSLGR